MVSSETTTPRPDAPGVTGTVTADWTPGMDAATATPLAAAIDRTLQLTAELARTTIGAHQSAAALIVADDWPHARKWFSLSPKYQEWFTYRAPAAGFGIHALVVEANKPLRLTQTELEAHPAWRGFGREAGKHPPMRGWLAVPIIGADGRNYGLLQLSDKDGDAEFNSEDEERLLQLAALTAITLDSLRAHHGDDRVGRPS